MTEYLNINEVAELLQRRRVTVSDFRAFDPAFPERDIAASYAARRIMFRKADCIAYREKLLNTGIPPEVTAGRRAVALARAAKKAEVNHG